MLFNSFEFIFVFLPLVIMAYYGLKKIASPGNAVIFLVLASLAFYSWWNPKYLLVLLLSILINYCLSLALCRTEGQITRKSLLIIGISLNLGALAYFKYANFLIDNINVWLGGQADSLDILLPLAISFFTFQQIAYLVDSYQGKTSAHRFTDYCLFVCFFPQLIAGPIVHYSEMMPQFSQSRSARFNADNIAIGLFIFSLGLAKKVLIADNMALYATPIFAKADQGSIITFIEAWQAALAYSLQLYFDFSGYCDMATGAARCFGIILPINFNSPYKANNIIDFWRRWHITLSRFLRDYLYIPLGGNRLGKPRRYINLFVTMLLGGLWHGAGWNFVMWGALHGFYLIINHGWHACYRLMPEAPTSLRALGQRCGIALTLLCVIFAWVFFRAETFAGALQIIDGMLAINGVAVPVKYLERWGDIGLWLQQAGVEFRYVEHFRTISPLYSICALWLVARWAPNGYDLVRAYQPVIGELATSRFEQILSPRLGIVIGLIFVTATVSMNKVSEFLYFQF